MNTISKALFFILLTAISISKAYAQPASFKALPDLLLSQPKPIIVEIYTTWCTYCKLQDKQIRTSDSLLNIIKKDFYMIQLDAEYKGNITFNNKTYGYRPNGLSTGVHELALALSNNGKNLSYPLWIVFDRNYNLLYSHAGYIKNNDLIKGLNHIKKEINYKVQD